MLSLARASEKGAAATSATRLLLLTYLTEPLDIDQNEEYGQKRKCPLGPLF